MQYSLSLLVIQSFELRGGRQGGFVGIEVSLNLILQLGHLGFWVGNVECFGNLDQLMFTFIAQRASEGRTATWVSAQIQICIGVV